MFMHCKHMIINHILGLFFVFKYEAQAVLGGFISSKNWILRY